MKTFLFITLASTLYVLSHQVYPPENKLSCKNVKSCPDDFPYLMNRYIKVDGEEWSACAKCVAIDISTLTECPLMPCPMYSLPQGCIVNGFHDLYIKVGTGECRACDTAQCA